MSMLGPINIYMPHEIPCGAIINATPNPLSKELEGAGVVDCPKEIKDKLKKLFEFDAIPTHRELTSVRNKLGDILGELEREFGEGRYYLVTGPVWLTPYYATIAWDYQLLFAYYEPVVHETSARRVTYVGQKRLVGFIPFGV